jgi:ABC-2 type transport system ATP-binding protein
MPEVAWLWWLQVIECAHHGPGAEGAATAAGIELEGVYRRFGRTMVLAGFDLTVDEGELYGLIGPNGAGKTTALRVALGLLWPDGGRVRLLGRTSARRPGRGHRGSAA